MYLSCLMIDVGLNPDRPRPGRLWLRNRYHVHQRLCMGFPSTGRKETDAQFLLPFTPDDFPAARFLADRSLRTGEISREKLKDVHAPRNDDQGFLYRIDSRPGCAPVIVVQSSAMPDWDYAFHNAGFLLAAPPQVSQCEPHYENGAYHRFRLLANPTRKIDTKSGPDGARRHGRRVPLAPDRFTEWLSRKGEVGGFVLDERSTLVKGGFISWRKPGDDRGQKLRSVRYDGVLRIRDSALFERAILGGIGPGKAFGFGLLSVAPYQEEAD